MKIQANFDGLELKASYHKPRATYTEYSPEALEVFQAYGEEIPTANDDFISAVNALSPLPFVDFYRSGTSTTTTKPMYTYQNLINLEMNTRRKAIDGHPAEHELDRVVFHGQAFRNWDLNVSVILDQAELRDFYVQRIDLNFDVSADYVPFSVIDYHFSNDLLTTQASYHPHGGKTEANGKKGPKSWYCGTGRGNGYRVLMYESARIHPELPEGAWRVETQLYGKTAQQFAQEYQDNPTAETITTFMLSALKARLQFREKSTDSNMSRWPIPNWWQWILEGAGNYSEHRPVTRKVRGKKNRERMYQDLKKLRDRDIEMFWGVLDTLQREYPRI